MRNELDFPSSEFVEEMELLFEQNRQKREEGNYDPNWAAIHINKLTSSDEQVWEKINRGELTREEYQAYLETIPKDEASRYVFIFNIIGEKLRALLGLQSNDQSPNPQPIY
ncbi:hypothetical protein HY405_01870 [Candidatus Microgenomates bacterium]|nr:hypothetical protein [Candidatus Microgenomates bacterium]